MKKLKHQEKYRLSKIIQKLIDEDIALRKVTNTVSEEFEKERTEELQGIIEHLEKSSNHLKESIKEIEQITLK